MRERSPWRRGRARPDRAWQPILESDASWLKVRGLLIGAEYITQRSTNLAQRGVCPHRVQNIRHGVCSSFGCASQGIQPGLNRMLIAALPQPLELGFLVLRRGFIDLQQFDGLVIGLKTIDP